MSTGFLMSNFLMANLEAVSICACRNKKRDYPFKSAFPNRLLSLSLSFSSDRISALFSFNRNPIRVFLIVNDFRSLFPIREVFRILFIEDIDIECGFLKERIFAVWVNNNLFFFMYVLKFINISKHMIRMSQREAMKMWWNIVFLMIKTLQLNKTNVKHITYITGRKSSKCGDILY